MRAFGIESTPKAPLRRQLLKWAILNRRMVGVWRHRGLLPWMGNERTHVSVLSAAIWTSRGIALEEVPDEKRNSAHRRTRRTKPGQDRVDLLCDIGTDRYAVEAKAAHLTISDRTGIPIRQVTKRFGKAIKDTLRTPARGRTRLAVLFVHLRVHPEYRKQIDSRLSVLLHKLRGNRRSIGYHSLAWSFPHSARAYRDKEGFFHPGTFALLARVRGHRSQD